MKEHQRHLRDHDFIPTDAASWPALYETEETPLRQKLVVARYQMGAMTWLILERDPEADRAFCWADLGVGGAELGYVMLDELEMTRAGIWIVVNRDAGAEAVRRGRAARGLALHADRARAGRLAPRERLTSDDARGIDGGALRSRLNSKRSL